MRPEVPDELDDADSVADGDFVGFPGDGLVHNQTVRQAGESLVLPEPRDPDEDVAVVSGYEGGVYAEVPGDRRPRPAPGERPPGSLQSLEGKVTEIGLQQLSDVVAELHVKIALEDDRALGLLPRRRRHRVVEDVEGRLAKHPRVRVVSRHHPHAYAQVTVTAEDVYRAAEPGLLRDRLPHYPEYRQREEQITRALPHLAVSS